jgi:hypothetical protein
MSADIPIASMRDGGDEQDRLNTERPLITEDDCEENPEGGIVANSSGKLDDEDQPPTDDNSDPKEENKLMGSSLVKQNESMLEFSVDERMAALATKGNRLVTDRQAKNKLKVVKSEIYPFKFIQ